ncbi:hypothetical protein J6590_074303 [Homalodisca vitripennis]|nr:hypothetical protein J6590_074303 [Homalodisca vitripennis]
MSRNNCSLKSLTEPDVFSLDHSSSRENNTIEIDEDTVARLLCKAEHCSGVFSLKDSSSRDTNAIKLQKALCHVSCVEQSTVLEYSALNISHLVILKQ